MAGTPLASLVFFILLFLIISFLLQLSTLHSLVLVLPALTLQHLLLSLLRWHSMPPDKRTLPDGSMMMVLPPWFPSQPVLPLLAALLRPVLLLRHTSLWTLTACSI
jgi:hypothetical protein